MYSTVDPDEVRSKISQLRAFRNTEHLSDNEKKKLNDLWFQASKIEQMNDRCGSIDLTELMDDDCGNFYQYDLPQFEKAFFEVTGEIRLSPQRLSNAISNKRYAIEQCYDALQVEAFHPSRFYELNGNYTPEPLSNGFEVSYNFSLDRDHVAIDDMNQRLSSWIRICGDYIMHSDNSGSLAPLFKEKISQSRSEAKNVSGGLYFELESKQALVVKSIKNFSGIYYLNGKQLFQYNIPNGRTLFRIYLHKQRAEADLMDYGNRWHDKVVFKGSDESKGLAGRFHWKESSGSFSNSFNNYSNSSSNYSNSSNNSSY